jgi:hypothetical protein
MPVLPDKLPKGWRVYWDSFPDTDGRSDEPPYGLHPFDLNVDLLYALNTQRGVVLDLDWHPALDPKGRFRLRAIAAFRSRGKRPVEWDVAWENTPLRQYRSRSLARIRGKINDWVVDDTLRSPSKK